MRKDFLKKKKHGRIRSVILLATAIAMLTTVQAQNKLVPASQSALTGIMLPTGSKKDGRFLSEASGKTLLEMESKKVNASVKTVEILSLPAATASGFTADSLSGRFSALGWRLTPVESDNKYVWLQKDNRYIIAYFSVGKNATELYFGETTSAPLISFTNNNPASDVQQPVQQSNTGEAGNSNSASEQINIQQPAPANGYTFTTTNFDNGWTSTIYDEYVLTTKGAIKVYLSYIEKFDESRFSGTGLEKRHYYWDNYVSKCYITGEKKFDTRGILSDYSQDYIEGWATDKQTGEKRYIAMIINIIAFTGRLSIIIASAPDDQQLRLQFPKADGRYDNDLLPMYGYNKFAVGKNDLPGTWSTNGGGTMSWYSTTTGQNVGATGVATSDVFNFEPGSSYTSEHKGASGWVGAMNIYQQKYKGTYTVTDWTVTATNRWNGKTEKFDAWFEIVKGGRILHLTSEGIDLKLVKEK